jgi:UDP-N-acetylglucosamine 2-epimerase (non-hydrolysing)
MTNNLRILICFGTRPEYIKVKSLIDNLPNIKTCFTGQHINLLENINVDYKLSIEDNISDNRLNNIICNIMKYTHIFKDIDYVLVQGDTTSALGMGMSAFNNGIKIIHLEAGLRSNDILDPFPEEANRQLISRLASIHLCPTEFNKANLEKENVQGKIYVVGNTGLDNIDKSGCEYGNQVLITMHRRDNLDLMDKWFETLEHIANKYPEIEFTIPLHPNPSIQKHKYIFNKVKVVEPLTHDELINYIKKCKFVISDSGGLQEECSFLNKKIIVCRKTTERPESVGTHSFMCGDPDNLEGLVDEIMVKYEVNAECPYGNSNSWKNISIILKNNYWNNFYKLYNNFNYEPSTFFNFVIEYLKDYPEHKTLIDLGCGNGRDLIHFSKNGLNCYGIDYSNVACTILKKRNSELNIICDSFIDYDYKGFDIYYSRFTLHAVNYENVLKFIHNISERMSEKSLLFIETRSIMGTEYSDLDYYEANFNSGIGDFHDRTLFKKDYLINLFNKKDIFVEYELEDKGLSPYKGDDPYLIRLVLRKVNVENFLDKICNYKTKIIQKHKTREFNKIIDIFNKNNIDYNIFFGNLIGLLRHNKLFIPWDDDIDILVDYKDNIKIINLLKNNYDILFINNELLQIKKNNIYLVDIFYNLKFYNKYIKNYNFNVHNYEIFNDYKIPEKYENIFEEFYGKLSNNFMNTCFIWNHDHNSRWKDKKIQIKCDIKKINDILLYNENNLISKIKNLINDIKSQNNYDNLIKDVCLFIVPDSNYLCPIKLLTFIKSMLLFNRVVTFISISSDVYCLFEEYIDFFNKINIHLIIVDDIISIHSKTIIDYYLSLYDNLKLKYKDIKNIIIYQNFPIFVNNFNDLSNKNIYNLSNIDFDIDIWYNFEIKKDYDYLNSIGFYDFNSLNVNGLMLYVDDFLFILNEINLISENLKGYYPILELLIPLIIHKNNFKYFNLNYSNYSNDIKNTNNNFENFLSYTTI